MGSNTGVFPNTTDAYKALVEKIYGPENAEKVLSILPGSPDALSQSNALQSAIWFGAASKFVADSNSNLGKSTFLYYFTQAPNTTEGQQLGLPIHLGEHPADWQLQIQKVENGRSDHRMQPD